MPEVISHDQEIGGWTLIALDVTAMRLMIPCGLSRISSISLSLKRSDSGSGTSAPCLLSAFAKSNVDFRSICDVQIRSLDVSRVVG
jgi:hypothetical protein